MRIIENIPGGYFRVPAELLFNSKNANPRLSVAATLLLSFLVDRAELSAHNADKFTHSDGRIFVIMTINEVCERCSCGSEKAVSMIKELVDGGFIEKVRLGQGRPNRLFITDKTREIFSVKFKESVNGNSEVSQTDIPEIPESEGNQTNNNHNEYNHNNSNHSFSSDDYDRVVDELEEQIEADCFADNADIINEIVLLMADILTSDRAHMRIGGASVDMSLVRKRFAMLNSEHIEYVIGNLNNSESKIRNVRSYLISLLYNAPTCMASSVSADFGYFHKNGGN